MDDLLSEKEQIDQIRSWWKEYGAYVIGGIVIGVGGLLGYNHYQKSTLEAQLAASTAYESLVVHVADGKLDDAEAVANEIATSYSDTTYMGQSGLAMARLYMDKNRDQDAADALLTIVNGDSDDELKHVARLRLARIYLYQDKPQEVVDLLADQDNDAFASSYGEVLGDAYTTLGQVAEAQESYQKVLLDPLSQGTIDQQLVQWKSLDLPEVVVDEAVDEIDEVGEVGEVGESAEPEAAEPVEADDAASEENE